MGTKLLLGPSLSLLRRRSGSSKTMTLDSSPLVRFFGGSVLCCSSIIDSYIRSGNVRVVRSYESSVAEKVWALAKNLGVSGAVEDSDMVAKIRRKEERDQKAKLERERNNYSS